jgi:AraC-like DNA-binding protein
MSTYRSQQVVYNHERTILGRVTLAGYIYDGNGVQGPRVLGSYALVYLLAGSGWYCDTAGREERVRAGDLLMLAPDVGHSYGPAAGESWNEFYCVFDGPAFDLLRDVGLLAAERVIMHLPAIDTWLGRFEAALPSPALVTLSERTIALSRFIQLVTEIVALDRDASHPVTPAWIPQACRLLAAELDRSDAPRAIAAQIGVPYETFRKVFQRTIGDSPGRYHMTRRIDAACKLLLETDLTLAAIAERLGFANEFHFSRRFKQIAGLAPREFRRQMPQRNRRDRSGG